MANFKRHKTKPKTFDGEGFNQTKDRDAISAAKKKGVPAKKAKAKKQYGLRVSDTYIRPNGEVMVSRFKWWKNPLVYEAWYETEKQRDSAERAYSKNHSLQYVDGWYTITRTVERLER